MKLIHILFVLFIFTSCTFEPEGLNFVAVEKPVTAPPVRFTLSQNEDSIYLFSDTQLTYNLEINLYLPNQGY